LPMSIPAQIQQLILYHNYYIDGVDGCAREFTFAKRLDKHFLRDKVELGPIFAVTPPEVIVRPVAPMRMPEDGRKMAWSCGTMILHACHPPHAS